MSELRKDLDHMQGIIKDLFCAFEEKHGIMIQAVDIDSICRMGNVQSEIVSVKIKLGLEGK